MARALFPSVITYSYLFKRTIWFYDRAWISCSRPNSNDVMLSCVFRLLPQSSLHCSTSIVFLFCTLFVFRYSRLLRESNALHYILMRNAFRNNHNTDHQREHHVKRMLKKWNRYNVVRCRISMIPIFVVLGSFWLFYSTFIFTLVEFFLLLILLCFIIFSLNIFIVPANEKCVFFSLKVLLNARCLFEWRKRLVLIEWPRYHFNIFTSFFKWRLICVGLAFLKSFVDVRWNKSVVKIINIWVGLGLIQTSKQIQKQIFWFLKEKMTILIFYRSKLQ